MRLERPDIGNDEFKQIAVRIAKVKRRRVIAETRLFLDRNTVCLKMPAPVVEFPRRDAEGDIRLAAPVPLTWRRD